MAESFEKRLEAAEKAYRAKYDRGPKLTLPEQSDVVVALAGAAHGAQSVDKLAVEPNPNQPVGTRARRRVGGA
jgi:hypothetical protein